MFTTRPGGLLQLHTLTSWLDRKDDTAKRPVATVAKGSIVDVRAGWAKRQMGQDSKLRSLPSELLIVGDHEVSPVVNDSVGNCTGNCSLAANQKPVRSTSWLHRSIPSRPSWVTAGMSEATSVGRVQKREDADDAVGQDNGLGQPAR